MTDKHKTPFAFISYSRYDKDIVLDIFRRIEKYPYPKKWVEAQNRPQDEKYVRPLFLDLADLSISHRDFSEEIRENLRTARYLIVFCSKNSAKSEFVKKEIDYFLKHHGNNTDLIVAVYINQIFQGMHPVIDNIVATRNCPIYTTDDGYAGKIGRKYCLYHIIEFLLKVDFSRLYNRYDRHKRRKRQSKIALLLLFAAIVTGIALYGWKTEKKKAEIEGRRAMIEHERVRFEMGVFPYSLVTGYVNNFLRPTLSVLNDSCHDTPHMIIFMPNDTLELNDSVRNQKYTSYIKRHYPFEGYVTENINIPGRHRASSVTKMVFSDRDLPIYKDDARTVAAFRSVIDYKLSAKNPVKVPQSVRERFTQTYTDSFVVFAERELPQYKSQVHYIKDTMTLGRLLDHLLK